MAENHELRLQINAAAARAGAKDFVSAIRAMQSAIETLDSKGSKALDRLDAKVKQAGSAFSTLAGKYNTARLASERFTDSVNKANAALRKQIALSKQLKGVGGAQAAREAVRLSRAHARAATAAPRASGGGGKAADAAKQAAQAQLLVANALRRSEIEAERLRARLMAIGDTKGVANVTRALSTLRANLKDAGTSSLKARQAMSQFSDATQAAKVAIVRASAAQQKAAASARRMAQQQKEAAAAARSVEREMRSIAGAGTAVSKSMRNATGNMRGLENAFSSTFQVGTLFRVMLGSLTLGTFIKSVYGAGAALNQFRVTMEVATGSMSGAAEQMDFVDNMARTLGTNLRTTREDFAKFAVASNLAGVNMAAARDIFESVSQAMTVMGRGAEDQRLAFLALEQMMSKGTISSEELRRQLGERLPGAVALMAKAVGVSTGQLQKLLKEGKLASAEVLPKFAKEVRNAFGPGLEQALNRAPAALGRLRNEFEFFLSAVADAGFMDALAQGFNDLTKAMQSEEAADAAKKLGAGLADLAEISVTFAETVITNIDKIGTVAKAVISGMLVRQALLLGNALMTAGARASSAFALTTAAMAGNTAASAANATALVKDTAATTKLATAQKSLTAMTAQQAASQLRANLVMSASAVNAKRASTAMMFMSTASKKAATGLVAASRAVVGLAGPIGMLVAGLSLVLPMFSGVGDAASKMSDELESALRRSGVALDEFKNKADSSTNIKFNRIVDDLDTLGTYLDSFKTTHKDAFLGIALALKILNGELEATDRVGNDAMMAFAQLGVTVGASEQQLRTLSGTTRSVVVDLYEAVEAAAESGTGFTELRARIHEAMRTTPGARGILKNLDAMIEKAALAEEAITANRLSLIELYGTTDEKALKDFASMAEKAVRSRDGLAELRDEMNRLKKVSPELAAGLQDIMTKTEKAFASGMGVRQFRATVIDVFDDTVTRIEAVKRAADEASKAAAEASKKFVTNTESTLSEMTTRGFSNLFTPEIGSGVAAELGSILETFREFGTLEEPLLSVSEAMQSIHFDTDSAQQFADALIDQVSVLAEADASYQTVAQSIAEIDKKFETVDASKLVDALSDIAKNTDATIAALEAQRDALDEGAVAARDHIDALIEEARASGDAEIRAYAAEAAAYAAADAAREAGAAGRDGADGMYQLANAFSAISGSGFAAAASIGAKVAEVQHQIDLKSMDYITRKVTIATDRIKKDIDTATAQVHQTFNQQLAAGVEAGVDMGILRKTLERQKADALLMIETQTKEFQAKVKELALTETNNEGKPDFGKGKGGGGGRKKHKKTAAEIKNLTDALKEMRKGLIESVRSMDEENTALQLMASGFTTSEKAARLLAKAQAAGATKFDAQTMAMVRQIEAAERLNEALSQVANDPVNDWMKSVATWREAGQQIEVGVFDTLSDSISEFIQTGKFSFEDLSQSILGTVADLMADMAVKELVALFGGNVTGQGEGGFGLGGIMSDMFANKSVGQPEGDPLAAGFNQQEQGLVLQNSMVTGGQQAAEIIHASMVQAGQRVGQHITTGGQQAAVQMGTQVNAAGSSAAVQMGTQTQIGGSVAGSSMMASTQAGGSVAAQQMQTAIVSGGSAAAAQIGAAASGGGGGGGGFGGGGGLTGMLIGAGLSLVGSLFGGKKHTPSAPQAPITPIGVPTYAEGTANTSGIPAILHDNEAVIPLSGNRKVPVEFAGDTDRGGRTLVQNFNITTPDADSFRKSQKQIALEAATTGQKALADNG